MEKLFNQLINQRVAVEDEVPASNTQKALIENLLKEIERLNGGGIDGIHSNLVLPSGYICIVFNTR